MAGGLYEVRKVSRRGARVAVLSGQWRGRHGVVIRGNGSGDYVALCDTGLIPVRTLSGEWVLVSPEAIRQAEVRCLSNAQIADVEGP